MRKYKAVFMRGGTSKGLVFLKKDLPDDRGQWDSIFLQAMGSPDPKQIDGLGGTVSSNNKVVVVWSSSKEGVDVEYLVGQVIVGKNQVDYKSNCGNMTAAVGPFAVEEGLVDIVESITTVRMLNRNTDKYIEVTVPITNGVFAEDGNCSIAGVDGTAAELKVNFMNPAGAKTGQLLPTGNLVDTLTIPDFGELKVSILDVSNPMVMVRAEDVGLTATEQPEEINNHLAAGKLLEKIRGTAACMMGFATDLADAEMNSPAVPKVGVFTNPKSFLDLTGHTVDAQSMDMCVRVISVFKCHKACPLTSASAFAVATQLEGTLLNKAISCAQSHQVRIGHPSGVMTLFPQVVKNNVGYEVPGIAVQRTARRIMDGTVYIKN